MPTAASSSSTRTAADVRARTIEKVREFYRPQKPDPAIVTRKAKFEAILRLVSDLCGWVTSVPGAAEIRIETLPDSPIPDELRELGFKVERDEPSTGERILPAAIIETAMRGPDGGLVPIVEGSTMPIVEIRHAGITPVHRWRIML